MKASKKRKREDLEAPIIYQKQEKRDKHDF